jgi:hypothetical protein
MISIRGALRSILGTIAVANSLILLRTNDIEAEQPPDPRQAMVTVLSASSPHPSLGDEARVWDRFIGTWDCQNTFFLDDGSRRQSRGEIEFGWIMDGRAVQDIWITYPQEAGKERGIGTTVRFFDSKSKMWRIVFVGPRYNALVTLQGSAEGDRIVLRGVDDEGAMLRWSFNDIRADFFTWRGEKSRDGGKTWKLEEEHHMKRRNSYATAKPPTG